MTLLEEIPSMILLYHRIGSPLTRSIVRGQYVLPALLRWQVNTVSRQGYHPLTLRALLQEERATGHYAVTFDDGYLSVALRAWPIFAMQAIPATVFAVANLVGGTNWWDERLGDRTEKLLGKRELCALAAAGWEIGSHSASHVRLTALAPVSRREEVRGSKARLEDLLGVPVDGFSYPYGEWDARVRDEVIEAGYQYAVTTRPGALPAGHDRFALPRINIRWNTAGALLRHQLARARKQAAGAETLES